METIDTCISVPLQEKGNLAMPSPSLVVQAVGAARFCRAWAELRWEQPGEEMLPELWAALCI